MAASKSALPAIVPKWLSDLRGHFRLPIHKRFVDHEVSFAQFIDEFSSGQHGFDAVHPLFYRFTLGHQLRERGVKCDRKTGVIR